MKMTRLEPLDPLILIQTKAIREIHEGILIDLEVTAGSVENRITGYNRWRDRITVQIKANARKGKANKELLKLMANLLGTKMDNIRIVAGIHSELKTLEIIGFNKDQIKSILTEVVNE
jgi:uncharacterized protein (TIGR00251 family)